MPELPEVETTRRGVEPHVVGRRIVALNLHEPGCAGRCRAPCPRNWRDSASAWRGGAPSTCCIELESGTLLLHLGMSGSLRVLPAETPRIAHDHFDLVLDSGNDAALQRSAPLRQPALHDRRSARESSAAASASRPSRSTRRSMPTICGASRGGARVAIKQLIMNSQLVVGVGNIYASEALFRARIRPRARRAGSRAPKSRSWCARSAVLAMAMRVGRHDAARLRGRRRQPGILPTEALRLRARGQALPRVPHAGPAVHARPALDLLLPDLPEMIDDDPQSRPIVAHLSPRSIRVLAGARSVPPGRTR